MTNPKDTPKAVQVEELTQYLDALLKVSTFKDYCPNGLQVAGNTDIRQLYLESLPHRHYLKLRMHNMQI